MFTFEKVFDRYIVNQIKYKPGVCTQSGFHEYFTGIRQFRKEKRICLYLFEKKIVIYSYPFLAGEAPKKRFWQTTTVLR